jgi:hypothetical protein
MQLLYNTMILMASLIKGLGVHTLKALKIIFPPQLKILSRE